MTTPPITNTGNVEKPAETQAEWKAMQLLRKTLAPLSPYQRIEVLKNLAQQFPEWKIKVNGHEVEK